MRVRGSREWNPFFERKPDDGIAWVQLVHRLAPAGGGKFNRQIARTNELQGFIDDRADVAARAMSVNLDQIEVRQTIDESGRGNFADPAKVVCVDFVDVAADELSRAVRDGVEHFRRIV